MTRFKSVITAFFVLLSIFIISHIFKFPGSVAYLMEITQGKKILDMQASFSSVETYQRLEAYGEPGRQMYMRTMLTVDLIFPISMAVFLFLLARYTWQRLDMNPFLGTSIQSLSVAYLVLDFLENSTIFFLLLKFPDRLEFLGSYIGYLTIGKRSAMYGAMLIPLILLLSAKVFSLLQRPNSTRI